MIITIHCLGDIDFSKVRARMIIEITAAIHRMPDHELLKKGWIDYIFPKDTFESSDPPHGVIYVDADEDVMGVPRSDVFAHLESNIAEAFKKVIGKKSRVRVIIRPYSSQMREHLWV